MSGDGTNGVWLGHLSERARRVGPSPIGGLMVRALEQPELISLAAGFVDQASLPVEAARSAALSALAEPEAARAALQYGTTAGDPQLREQIARAIAEADVAAMKDASSAGAEHPAPLNTPRADHMLITAGSNQILALLAEALLDPGDVILCDAPTYFVFTSIVKGLAGRCIGIAADEHGMQLSALEAELERHAQRGQLHRIKAVYVMSYFDNPRGVSLAGQRRAELVRLVARYSHDRPIYVIEDAAYRELRYEGADLPSLFAYDAAQELVIYTGTFSKSFAPGVRVGYGVFPPELLQVMLALKTNLDFGSPYLNQRLVSHALSNGLYEPHVALLRSVYGRKAACMLDALEAERPRLGDARWLRPRGGMYVWLELPAHVDTGEHGRLFARACELGVLYVPGEACFPEGTASRSSMRLSFGVQSEARIAEGIAKLVRAIREQL